MKDLLLAAKAFYSIGEFLANSFKNWLLSVDSDIYF